MFQNIESDESSSTSIIDRIANDGNDTEEDIEEPAAKKTRGENLPYDLFKTYDGLEECVKELKDGTIENVT
ncbi:unnamed protein product [Brachionus calyciflorus]|uniref:Uncharacterized protein n=1 Tax=Brachionus calyciflorus TaxID=104777 RepID=A0A814HRY4_9BILA|nr:unnamed protein product [Brachionus calyciflorus]